MKMFNLFVLSIIGLFPLVANAQDCSTTLVYTLQNIKGGYYTNQTVILVSRDGKTTFNQTTDSKGMVTFQVPCETLFDLKISNYSHSEEIISGRKGSQIRQVLSYEPDMKEKELAFAMTEAEKQNLNKTISLLPDTTINPTGVSKTPAKSEYYEYFTIIIKDLNQVPLANESVTISGIKRNKHFKCRTSTTGEIFVYLPKGDDYTINFKYHQAYRKFDSEYKNGMTRSRMEITYIGSKEFERRKKAEEERIKAEEKRLEEERIAFEKYCKDRRISHEEGFRLKLLEKNSVSEEDVVGKVLSRNNWSEKLIVCDLTGSMDPYAQQLAVWYQLNMKKETNLQFVFFNDGNNLEDSKKKIGATGGIYFQKSKGLDSLIYMMSHVRANGNGGDCAENNMEALIKGVQKSQPYKELVMIVDNNAPVKDISLLNQFNKPVHIILCGVEHDEIMLDYLLIAWKTKGTLHTIEEDISKIASMSEGETIQIGAYTYQILGGSFVRITKS